MIVIDLEMSGLNANKCGILEIGAIELENPENTFFAKTKLDKEDVVWNDPSASSTVEKVLGIDETEMRNPSREDQKEVLRKLSEWTSKIKNKTYVYQNFIDYQFLRNKCLKYNLPSPHWRNLDIHSIGQTVYLRIKGQFLLNQEGHSDLGLKNLSAFVGLKDERTIHNALEDAKFEAEILSRLLYGKNLLPEYSKFSIPEKLKK